MTPKEPEKAKYARLRNVAFSPDGKTVAAGLFNHTIALWESTIPPAGYELRRDGAAARKAVDDLYHKYGFYFEVLDKLKADKTINGSIRELALKIANSHRWEDGEKLRNEAWTSIILPNKDIISYRTAFDKVSKANSLEPNDPAILNTLGAVQYRLGSYEDALKTLIKAEQIISYAEEEPDAENMAFKSMALQRIGRFEEAKAALDRLRELSKEGQPLFLNMEVQGLLAEAEKLIIGEKK